MTRRQLALAAFAVFDLLLFVALIGLWVVRSDLSEQKALSELGVALLEQQEPINGFRLTDQNGEVFTEAELTGKWQLIFFGFTSCPDICPLTMQALEGFYRNLEPAALRSETGVIMVSVDPVRDSPEVMARYLASFHPDFVGLTGEYPQIDALASQLYVAFSRPGEHDMGHGVDHDVIPHSDYIAVVGPTGKLEAILRAPHFPERLQQAFLAVRERR